MPWLSQSTDPIFRKRERVHRDGLPSQARIPDVDTLWGKQACEVCHSTHQSPVNVCALNVNLEWEKSKENPADWNCGFFPSGGKSTLRKARIFTPKH